MERTPFTVPTESGELSGWVAGEGPRVLAIHGGPGMNYDYLDDAVRELVPRYQVATFQQRGLAPSTLQGESRNRLLRGIAIPSRLAFPRGGWTTSRSADTLAAEHAFEPRSRRR